MEIEEGLARYRELLPDFEALVEASERRLPRTIRCNALKTTPGELEERLPFPAERLEWADDLFRIEEGSPGNSLEHFLGLYHVQEEVSCIPPKALAPEPGERVLDLCAAPGSKTTQLSAEMGNTGCLVANDVSLGRIQALKSNLDRLGAANVAVTRRDGARFEAEEGFDRILLDPPCSSEGTCRKDPETLEEAEKRRESLPGLQRRLMEVAASLLRPGGVLTYSTCTYAPEENEAVVAHGLERGLEVAEMEGVPEGRPGVTEWRGEEFPGEVELCRRYYPQDLDSGGFFVARMVKPC